MTLGLTFHHLALALRKEDAALDLLAGLGYEPGERLYDPEQKVYVRLCTAAGQPASCSRSASTSSIFAARAVCSDSALRSSSPLA